MDLKEQFDYRIIISTQSNNYYSVVSIKRTGCNKQTG